MSKPWDDESRAAVIQEYKDGNPTAENSIELIKEIAEKHDQSPNGVRMILSKAGVYVKKDPTVPSDSAKKPTTGEPAKRVSKEAQINALRATIMAKGKTVDEDVIDKLTGKAAAYFDSILK